jgi:exopolyphosphatase / guanosine-5'-triphosphate,3'-diphosphate pyrophosphatase
MRDDVVAERAWVVSAPVVLAAVDVGSNSFHVVVVQANPDGSVRVLERAKEMVRLGELSLHDGVIPREAFERGLRALRALVTMARAHRPAAILALATSAVREASNGPDFLEAAQRECGVPIRAIDGIEEARLIYLGARQALALSGRRAALFDVGGGSTEAVLGSEHEALLASSLKLGVLRLRDGWLRADPPSPADRTVMADWVRTIAEPTIARFRATGFEAVALTSGTALALARLAGRRLPRVAGIDRYQLTLSALREWEEKLTTMTVAGRLQLPGLDHGRADTIVPGVVILRVLLESTGAQEATVCDAALREGMIAEYLMRTQAPATHQLRVTQPARPFPPLARLARR